MMASHSQPLVMHTPGSPVSGTAFVASSGVTWRRFACTAVWLNEGGYLNFAVTLNSGDSTGKQRILDRRERL
jgi:hypothetical protein